MALKTKFTDHGFPVVDNKVRTTKSPLVGFEWEVPYDFSSYKPFRDNGYDEIDEYEYAEYFAEETNGFNWAFRSGFSVHPECGGFEFASPITNTIAVARRAARELIRHVNSKSFLKPDGQRSQCGIHVHVSEPVARTVHSLDRQRCTLNTIFAMLNRESSYNFIYKFSGRGNGDSFYRCQGQASRWDTKLEYMARPDRDPSDINHHNDMLRNNGHGTIEFRIWHSDQKLLIPAIEFAHSVYKFVHYQPVVTRLSDVPYLKDYKKWLMKQPGYKTLKQQAPWSLIHD